MALEGVAAEWQARLIVLGVRRAKATIAHLTEGTAYKVARQAPCPVDVIHTSPHLLFLGR